jgi:hypothetical protein
VGKADSACSGRYGLKPVIDGATFGSITVDGQKFEHDIIIDLDGRVAKREKKLSKQIYGTSHIISLDEAQQIHQGGATELVVGTGHFGRVKLSDEAATYFRAGGCHVNLLSMKKAIKAWNEASGDLIGLFHVTC